MKRPISIAQLLSEKQDKEKISTATTRGPSPPKFLSKDKRLRKDLKPNNEHASTDSSVNNPVKSSQQKLDAVNHVTERRDEEIYPKVVKKQKFQFEWDSTDDTMTDQEPITDITISELLPKDKLYTKSSGIKDLETAYMGKHWRDKSLQEMTNRDWRILREDFNISTKGSNMKEPLRNWEEFHALPKWLYDIIVLKLQFREPTPIQRIALPNMCGKSSSKIYRDFMGVASTGSGKTLAFLVSILIKLEKAPARPTALKVMEGPKALILVPTRELAQQIESECLKLIHASTDSVAANYNVLSIVGGHSMGEISNILSRGCDILIATPGRLIDTLNAHLLVTDGVETVVLDEADKMIDFGFEEQLTTILARLDASAGLKNCQTLMFTATMSPTIEKIANGYMKQPGYATIGSAESSVPHIRQLFEYEPTEELKFQKLKKELTLFKAPIIIFVTYKKTADWLANKFYDEARFKVTVLHGSKSQEQREASLRKLREGSVQIMIATNVAARGIDIPNVSLVVNFELPKIFEDYVHRIGRTGRAGKKGTAITFIGESEDASIVHELYKYMDKSCKLLPSGRRHETSFPTILMKKYNITTSSNDEIIY